MQKYTFLVEIGTEELPPKILKKLGCDFADHISSELKKNSIYCIEMQWFASPRHLAVKSKIGMSNENFLCISNPNKDSFHNLSNITDISNNQDVVLVIDDIQKKYNIENNHSFHNLLCKIIVAVLMKLTNYEMMRWGEIKIPFIRPIHTVTILLDTYLIRDCFFGINTDRILRGHQFMKNNKIIINHADDYPDILYKQGKVIVDYNKRKEIICLGIKEEAKKIGGIVNIEDNDLIDEITSLVEWPVVLSGKFDNKFLNLPSEIIHYIMKYDQKYFPVYNPINSMLLPYFIFVANIITKNYAQIIIGYENVIKPRLMDAEFFFKKDSRYRLADYMCKLDSVLFHRKLGTLRDKSFRIASLSGWIASKIGEDINQAKRAGYLCKCDLVSNMVFEFPLTQGIIGMYYARRDGESETVALAQKEHYYPRFATDILPTTHISCAVAIADKMDTITGIFGIEELPRGNRDPFALKRSAFGILRILIQKKIPLNLSDLIKESVRLYGLKLINTTVIDDIYLFMYKRLYSWYCMNKFKIDIIKAVLSIDYLNVLNVDARIHAVDAFCSFKKEESTKLCLIYKRIVNIMSNQQISANEDIQNVLLQLPAEIQLVDQIILVEGKIKFFLEKSAYYEILILFITLFIPINNFFDNVVVMDANEMVRKNRLLLLGKIKSLFLQVMDISFLHI